MVSIAMPLPKALRLDIEKKKALRRIAREKHPNLVAAESAINHLRSACGILATNRNADPARWKIAKPDVNMEVMSGAQDDVDLNTRKKIKRLHSALEEIVETADKVKPEAEYAETHGVGNCEYQTSVAFEYLKRMGIRALDIVFYAPFDQNARMPVKRLAQKDVEMLGTISAGKPNSCDGCAASNGFWRAPPRRVSMA